MTQTDLRLHVAISNIEEAQSRILRKLQARLEQHGPYSYASTHEILGIIAEEYHEFVEAVQSNDSKEVESELIDIAVGCLFGVASLLELGKIE